MRRRFSQSRMSSKKYNPLIVPHPEKWLALPEDERIALIKTYHEQEGIEMPNFFIHAMMHTVIENQAALGDEMPVAAKLLSLQKEGLDRHDAIHAVASVLANYLFDAANDNSASNDVNADYEEGVRQLTKQSWLNSFEE